MKPRAGATRLVLDSMVRTAASSGISEKAANAGCIERSGDDPRVNKTVLSRVGDGIGHPQFDLARLMSAISMPSVAVAVWRAKLVRTRISSLHPEH